MMTSRSSRVVCALFCASVAFAVEKKPPKVIVQEVEACISKLGHQAFKVRRQATRRLIEIATFAKPGPGLYGWYHDTSTIFRHKEAGQCGPDGPVPHCPNEDYVLNRLRREFRHDDPEVSERAREIVEAIKPKKSKKAIRDGGMVIDIGE